MEGVEDADDLAALLASQGLDSRGLKITMEDGPLTAIWPLFDDPMRHHIQAVAKKWIADLHSCDGCREYWAALDMNPHGLVHAPQTGTRRLVRAIRDSGTYVMTTADIVGGIEWLGDESFWSDPHVQQAVPVPQLEHLAVPDVEDKMWEEGIGLYLPELSERGTRRWTRWAKKIAPSRIEKAVQFIGDLHQVGVPLVIGTDAGGSPVVPWLVHGPSMEMEVTLM